MSDRQLSLWDDDQPPAQVADIGGRRGRWLTQIRQMMACVSMAPTMRELLETAAEQAQGELDGNREWGTLFEARLASLINSDATWQSTLSADAVGLSAGADLDLESVEVVPVGGVSYADLMVRLTRRGGRSVAVPVNVKTVGAGKAGGGLVCSLLTFVRLATEEGWDPQAPPSNTGYDVDAAILEWLGGGTKILYGRDYYLLEVTTDGDRAYAGHRLVGLLSSVRPSGSPLVARHPSRDNVVWSGGEVVPLPPDYDINTMTAQALLPRPSKSKVAALRVADAIARGLAPADALDEAA